MLPARNHGRLCRLARFSTEATTQAEPAQALLVVPGIRRGRRRAKTIKAVERTATRLHHRELVKQEIFDRYAVTSSRETSLRFHLFRTERPLSKVEKLRARQTLRPFGLLERFRSSELIALVEGPARRHFDNDLLWRQLERLFVVQSKILSIGEMSRILHSFAMRRQSRQLTDPPAKLLRVVSQRFCQEAAPCSFAELARLTDSFGTFSARDTKLLNHLSMVFPAVQSLQTEDGEFEAVVHLCRGLAALRWPDEAALRFTVRTVCESLEAWPPKRGKVLGLGNRTSPTNLYLLPAFEPEERREIIADADVVSICEALAILEVRAEALIHAVLKDVVTERGGAAQTLSQRRWRSAHLLGRLSRSLARLGVVDKQLTARWLQTVRREDRMNSQPRRPQEVLEVATTAYQIGAFHRDPTRIWELWDLRIFLCDQISCAEIDVEVEADGLIGGSTASLAELAVLSGLEESAQPEALTCCDDSWVPPPDGFETPKAEAALEGVILRWSAMSGSSSSSSSIALQYAVICSRLLSTEELLEAHRCCALLHVQEHLSGVPSASRTAFGHMDRCPDLAKVLWQRMAGIVADLSGESSSRFHELATFSSVAESLQRLSPAAVAPEEADLAMACGRALRARLGQGATLTMRATISVTEWCASTSVPCPKVTQICCETLVTKAKLFSGERLRRALFATLQARSSIFSLQKICAAPGDDVEQHELCAGDDRGFAWPSTSFVLKLCTESRPEPPSGCEECAGGEACEIPRANTTFFEHLLQMLPRWTSRPAHRLVRRLERLAALMLEGHMSTISVAQESSTYFVDLPTRGEGEGDAGASEHAAAFAARPGAFDPAALGRIQVVCLQWGLPPRRDRVYGRAPGHGAFFSKPTERLSQSRLPRRQMAERRSFIPDSSALTLAPEPPLGKVEYKLKLSAQEGTERFEELVTQLNWRMRECSSEEECAEVADLSQYRDAVYRLGVADDGAVLGLSDAELAESMSVLNAMAARIPATVTVLSRRTGIAPGNKTSITALIRAQTSALSLLGQGDQVRICTVGNVDSGKSTLLGLLTQGLRDDGRGRARSSVFRHRHELETGRTSCVSTMTLGFDQIGRVVNYKEDSEGVFRSEEPQHNAGRAEAQARIAEKASKLITFFDLCGHERYFKTTLQGMVGLAPDYLLCTVDANRGELRGMVHEHLVVANALAIPTVICLTKCDVAGEGQRTSALEDVKKFMKQMGTPTFVVKDANDVVLAAERILQGFTPIFLCSAVTGAMIPELKLLLNVLPRRPPLQAPAALSLPGSEALQIQIDEVFPQVPGVGLVVSGRVLHGTARPNDGIRLGPIVDTSGDLVKDGFISLRLASIRAQDHPVEELRAGSSGTFALKASGKARDALTPKVLSRSKILVGTKSPLTPSRWIKASITVLQHPSSIRVRYEPVLHVGMTRQTARVMSMSDAEGRPISLLRAGDSAEVLFRWAHWPEIIEPGCALVFRENSVKGVGTVTWVGDFEEPGPKKRRSGSRPQTAKVSKSANDKKRDRVARGARSEKAGKVSAKQKGRKGKRSKR
ncbi:GTPBP2 [Symbiodinium sp. CCMP2592]|nr:GTPBP2 [Symbiodinium sp. CCMP2592]